MKKITILNMNRLKLMLSVSVLTVMMLIAGNILVDGTAVAKEQSCEQTGLALPECKEVDTLPPIENNPIIAWVQFFINLVSAVIIVGASLMIAVAGLQYTAARDNAQSVEAAKKKISNIAGALLFYFFLYAFMQWLVPGGVF